MYIREIYTTEDTPHTEANEATDSQGLERQEKAGNKEALEVRKEMAVGGDPVLLQKIDAIVAKEGIKCVRLTLKYKKDNRSFGHCNVCQIDFVLQNASQCPFFLRQHLRMETMP